MTGVAVGVDAVASWTSRPRTNLAGTAPLISSSCGTTHLRPMDRGSDVSDAHAFALAPDLTYVEEAVFLGHRTTSWPATFRCADTDSREDVVARYRAAVAQANTIMDSCTDLSEPVSHAHRDRPGPSARWALTHMIEETARHAGHADILRELIDGATGR